MISQSERYGYVCEAKVTTFRKYFDPPPLRTVLKKLEKKLKTQLVPSVSYGLRTVSLTRTANLDGKTALLFRLSDPDIPDNILEHAEKKTLREAKREEGEVPALSAHVVLDPDGRFDARAAYPAIIENVDFFPRSLIQEYLIRVMGDSLEESRFDPKRQKILPFKPRIEFLGHPSKTVANVLKRGGSLVGLQFETIRLQDDGFGEDAYPVTRTEDVELRVAGRPRGEKALEMLGRIVGRYRTDPGTRIKITLEDESGRMKTSRVSTKTMDIAANYFILQERFDGLDLPLRACEEEVRVDLVRKMIEKLPR